MLQAVLPSPGSAKQRLMQTLSGNEVDWVGSEDLAFPFDVKCDGCDHVVVADEEGLLRILNTASMQLTSAFRAHYNAIFAVEWHKDDTQILTASGDQTVGIYNVERESLVTSLEGHRGSVKSVASMHNNDYVLASGARDGSIRMWDTRIRGESSVFTVPDAHVPQAFTGQASLVPSPRRKRRKTAAAATSSVSGVLFLGDDQILVSSGATDGLVKFWDTRMLDRNRHGKRQTPAPVSALAPCSMYACPRAHGIASLGLRGSSLLVNATDARVYMYNTASVDTGATSILIGHSQSSFYVRADQSPCGQFVACGSTDGQLHVWDLSDESALFRKPIVSLTGHEQEVNGVHWHPRDLGRIMSCSDDGTVVAWSVDPDQWENQRPRSTSVDLDLKPLESRPLPRNQTLTELWGI